MKQVKGKFEVKSAPLPVDEAVAALGAMRMMITKSFAGAIEGSSVVCMLGVMDKTSGSGAYVALEKVTGTLEGLWGTFGLQHSSSLTRGKPVQSITVIPDSGTDQLVGLTGSMIIDIKDGVHSYTFDYSL